MSSSIFQRVVSVQQRVQEELLAKRNVVGVAVGSRNADGEVTDIPAVVALVERKLPLAALSVSDTVPETINGIRTDVYEVGFLQAQQNPTDRFRPVIPSGVSIGHYKVTAGTLGMIVRDRTTDERLILSNNHVLANSNEAVAGDPILQPAAMDGGKNPGDIVAHLERFIELSYLEGPVTQPEPEPPVEDPVQPGSGCDIVDALVGISNLLARVTGSEKRVQATSFQSLSAQTTPVPDAPTGPVLAPDIRAQAAANNVADCALGKPVNPEMFSNSILGIGTIEGLRLPELGLRVRKHGRTTGLTEGNITLLNATVNVNYSTSAGSRTARFTGQVITDPMSQGGDSGSIIVEANSNRAVGLLFAGSSLATIFTPMQIVLDALNITL
jgi:hypothetical protein